MLQAEIEQAQRSVRTDAYQMSIGEVITMYKDSELIINPDFQRLFRWEIGQKSRLIESLLLGIPLPSIFVFEQQSAIWELVDGLQRISTILEFMGLLKSPSGGGLQAPSILEGTKYLPSLHNAVWEKSDRILDVPDSEQNEIGRDLQLAIRRARIGVEILKKSSDVKTKYDLFQRLNAGGTPANPQELRNCIIIMINNGYFQSIKEMSQIHSFLEVINVTVEQKERQRHMEFVTRFLVHVYVEYDGKLDVEEYIDESIIDLATRGEIATAEYCFRQTFDLLYRVYGKDALRRIEAGVPSGRVGQVAFECIAAGIGYNLNSIASLPNPEVFVRNRIEEFWKSADVSRYMSPGVRGTTRIRKTVPVGREWFRP